MLIDEPIDFLDRTAGTTRDAGAARAVDDIRLATLLRGHRQDDRLDVLELLVIGFQPLECLVIHTRDHLQQPFQRAHLLNLAHHAQEVLQVELPFLRNFALQLARFTLVERFLRLFDQAYYIALLQNPAGHAVGVENFDAIHPLTDTHELHRNAHRPANGKRGATAGVAVELRQNHTRQT